MKDPAKDRSTIVSLAEYKTHCERWAQTFEETPVQAPASKAEQPRMPRKNKYEMPANYLYWTLGAALGALLLGIATIPPEHAGQALPKTEVVRATEPALMPITATDSQNAPDAYFMILLDPQPQRAHPVARDLEATLKKSLAQEGFPNIGVSVSRNGEVYLAGTLFDNSEKGEIMGVVRGTPGVSRIHFADMQVRKLYGPAYFGAETERAAGGVAVKKIYSGSPAAMAGIRVGDVINHFGDARVSDPESLRFMVMSHVGGQRIPVELLRGGQPLIVTVRLGELPAIASER